MRTLMEIQNEDADIMAKGGDLPNYSKAGTGKTLSTLEAFKRSGHKRGLVLCPQIALSMWENEIRDWVGASAVVIRKGGTIPSVGGSRPDFVVTTFDLAGKSMRRQLYNEFNEGALILDEAHYLRRHDSRRTQSVFGNATDGRGGLMEKFDQVWSLTGNPIMRHNDDLYSQLIALYPWVFEKYGVTNYDQFLRVFCRVKVKQYHDRMPPKLAVVGSQNEAILNKILYKDIGAIRRLEAPDLPDLVETDLYPKLGVVPAEYAKRINKMTEAEILKALVGSDDDEDDEFSLQKVWQVVALAKVKGAVDYLMDASKNGPILIGVWHDSVGAAYKAELEKAGAKVKRVYGATSGAERERIRDQFNNGDIDFIVGQMAAMGVSWNLQAASNRVVIAQDHYSPGVIEQFYKRVYRKGQERTTYLDFLTSQHPLDKVMKKMRRDRERSQNKVLD